MFLEPLECRRLLNAVYPTPQEQYFVELVNRARANPTAEAKYYGILLNEGLPAGTLPPPPAQPLAINYYLNSSARKYSVALLDPPKGINPDKGALDHFLHNSTPGSRAQTEGYATANMGENLVSVSQAGPTPTLDAINYSHELLFKDFAPGLDVPGRGHRVNILRADRKEIGIGLALGKFNARNFLVGTQDFGLNGNRSFLTGVAFTDAVIDNDFYTPGEGLGKITIQAVRKSDGIKFTTKTWLAGGYSLPLDPGLYDVTASGAALGAPQTFYNIAINASNVKRDFVKPGNLDSTPPAASLQASNLVTGGPATLSFTVTYSDLHAIKLSTLDNNDIWVTAKGYSQAAKLVSKNLAANGVSIVATYRIAAPGGKWDKLDNATYFVWTVKKQVTDTAGKPVPTGKLGSFKVTIA
jgi:uncharacterized protein YkwD